MSETEGDYVGSAVTAIDSIEIWDYDEYIDEYGELPEDSIESDTEFDDGNVYFGEDEGDLK